MSNDGRESLILDLVNAIVKSTTVSDVGLFLQDLLTKKEILTLSRRLRIAKLLLQGLTYAEIKESLHVSQVTIAKVAGWLQERGDGFRKIVAKLPDEIKDKKWFERSEWDSFKRKYSLYFWPELLLEEIVKSANKRNKERIKEVLQRLEEKSDLHKRIENLLR